MFCLFFFFNGVNLFIGLFSKVDFLLGRKVDEKKILGLL